MKILGFSLPVADRPNQNLLLFDLSATGRLKPLFVTYFLGLTNKSVYLIFITFLPLIPKGKVLKIRLPLG
jgi:hypothetical protein